MKFKSCRADLLQEQHQDGDEGASLLLQSEETPWSSDKQLGVSVRHIVLETVLVDDHLYGLFVRGHQVVRPSVLARHFIPAGGKKTTASLISGQKWNQSCLFAEHPLLSPLQEATVGLPVGEAGPAHHHVLQQAEVGHLVLAAGDVKQHRGLHLVGLHASHIVRLLEGDERKETKLQVKVQCFYRERATSAGSTTQYPTGETLTVCGPLRFGCMTQPSCKTGQLS